MRFKEDHVFTVNSEGKYEEESLVRANIGSGIDAMIGIRTSDKQHERQSYIYNKDVWDSAKAKEHFEKHFKNKKGK